MRNWKHYGIVCLVAFIIFAFIACEKEMDPILCNCEIIEHLGIDEYCCDGDDCNCSEQIETLNGTDIIIRKQAGITVEQMNTSVAFITDYFHNKSSEATRDKIKAAITGFVIVPVVIEDNFPEIVVNAVKIGTIWYIGVDAAKADLDMSLFFGFN